MDPGSDCFIAFISGVSETTEETKAKRSEQLTAILPAPSCAVSCQPAAWTWERRTRAGRAFRDAESSLLIANS